jgi:hypothetical protein
VKDGTGNTLAGPVQSAADGTFTVDVPTPSLAQSLVFESSGGSFTDEATGAVANAGTLAAALPAAGLAVGSAVHLSPATTVVRDMLQHGKTLAEATSAFEAAFGFTPDPSVAPKNAPAAEADESSRLAAHRAAAFSQLAKDLGLTAAQQFELFHELAHDLLDGTLDGQGESGALTVGSMTLPEDLQARFAQAVPAALAGADNLTALTPDQIGTLPFGKVALTDTYRVEYLPGMMPAAQGKTQFKIKVSRRSDGTAVTGLTLSLMPMMHMATMSHTTPKDATIVDNADGTYSCTLYYLMGSGPGVGFWDLKVAVGGTGGETATFYPNVGMAMGGDSVRANLKGQSDTVAGMAGPAPRTYNLFSDGLAGTPGDHTFNVFLAAQEGMMSMPAVSPRTTLHDAQGAAWTVDTVTVEASTDAVTWIAGTNAAGGHWSVPGLTGLTSGVPGNIYVRLSVNGERKTTDGKAPAGSNEYATFAVTP